MRVPVLQERIDIGDSKINVKSNGITITLKKEDKTKHWTDIKPRKGLISDEKMNKKDDTMGDLMGMMKDLYQNGDDTMKQQIAKAWQSSQKNQAEGKTGLGGMPYPDKL